MSASVSRRTFVTGSAAAMAAVAGLAGLVGCGGSSTSAGSASSEEKVLYFGQANAKEGLDMFKSTNNLASTIADCVVDPLLRITEDLELVPALLKEVPTVEADGVTYKCELKDAKFSDGTPVTSADVKYSFERMFLPATAAKSISMYSMIKGASAMSAGESTNLDEGIIIEDDTHFSFVLEYPMAPFTWNLGINYADIFPKDACEAAGDQWGLGTNLIGSGPYKIEENDDTTKVVLVPNENFYDGTPNLDRIEISFIDDVSTKMMNFKNGDIDYCDLDSSIYDEYKDDADVKDCIDEYMMLGTNFIVLNNNSENLKDARVRQALSLAINRQEIVDTIESGSGIVASGFLNPNIPGHDDDAEDFPYDVEKAKSLMAEAGNPSISLTCEVRAGDYQKIMVAVQAYWAEIGVNLTINQVDNGVWSSDQAAGNIEVTNQNWSPLYPDADNQMYTFFYSENAAKKSCFYNNAEFDELMVTARKSSDEAERAELYKQADNIMSRTDYACIPLFYPVKHFVVRPWVIGAKVGNLVYHLNDIDIDNSKRS